MTQIHVVIRRVNPAIKVDLVQVGYIKDGQFHSLPFEAIADMPVSRFLKRSDISDSLFVYHSSISGLVSDCACLPGFGVEFFDNTIILLFDFKLDYDESAKKEEGKGN
jgi:hypothetical protein